jgi:hypothetical protein
MQYGIYSLCILGLLATCCYPYNVGHIAFRVKGQIVQDLAGQVETALSHGQPFRGTEMTRDPSRQNVKTSSIGLS